ncbi:MAG: transposase, partial [Chloroflexi bacterium]|nr:transposase [Chloroflexota bacterium]
MKWRIVGLVAILMLGVQLTQGTPGTLANENPDPVLLATRLAEPRGAGGWPGSWWSAVTLGYVAASSYVPGSGWQTLGARRRRRPALPRVAAVRPRVAARSPAPPGPRPPSQASASSEPVRAPTVPEPKSARVPLQLVLRPGVLLTGRGVHLRPLIAALGASVADALRGVLWADPPRFRATIRPVLAAPCALCGSQRGFRCIGSDRRSVIPPGGAAREWFRVQKVECRTCQAVTRVLPTFCLPFKSHHAQTIQNVLENCWRRNTSYRDTTAILNQSRPPDGQYVGHTLPYEWTIWLGGLTIHLPQFLVWLGLQLPRHGVLDEYFMAQDNGTTQHRIFAVTFQDPASTAIWNIVRVDRNDTAAFKQTLQQLQQVGVQLRAVTTDGWPAILKAVREELAGTIHLLCYFHAKKNVFETLEKYRQAKKLAADAPELDQWRQAFFAVLEAPNAKFYRARLRQLTQQVAAEPLLLARCRSWQKKSHYYTWRLRSPLLAATTSLVELTFKQLTRKVESL